MESPVLTKGASGNFRAVFLDLMSLLVTAFPLFPLALVSWDLFSFELL